MNLKSYATLIFDCDGVVLNSNRIKTEAFRAVTLPFGEAAASALVDYHTGYGGVSRYVKFEYFVDVILPAQAPGVAVADKTELLNSLLAEFSVAVKERLVHCEVAAGLSKLRDVTPDGRWMIVSGGDQAELREVFHHRGLDHDFDGGIHGSPKDKHRIVADLLVSGEMQRPALFLGDSRLDHEVAQAFDLDFVFLHQWTEFADWQHYCKQNGVSAIPAICDLLHGET